MEMVIDFPGGLKVNAHLGDMEINTDQPVQGGGDGSAPTPFALFLGSIGTCAGIYVLGFCKQRNIPTDGIKIVQKMENNPFSGLIENINLEIRLPDSFPEKYKDAVVRPANLCAVKKHFENPPKIAVAAVKVS